jgi:Uma2 family endonuclease
MIPLEMILEKYPQAQINDKDQIALRHYQQGRILIQNTPTGKEYAGLTPKMLTTF